MVFIFIGDPDPPSDLKYDNTVQIEDKIDLQWKRPSYTGGVALMNYVLEANNQTLRVEERRDEKKYSTGLVYGNTMLSAVNICGQKSQPAVINVIAKGKMVFLYRTYSHDESRGVESKK